MAIRNPKLFGLNVLSFLADVENKNSALRSLNLPPLDLDVIRGSSNAGTTRLDFRSLSRLKQPLHKLLDRYNADSSHYTGILNDRAGTDSILFGNLDINGALSGNAIRYRYIKTFGASGTTGIADISTSRVSAWSSSANPVIATSPISYGARVGIKAGSALKFGTQRGAGDATGNRLKTTLVPQQKEFNSEFPTSEVEATIGPDTIRLYAMKGIPIIFTGFFRNVNATIKLNSLINNTSPSWRIVETNNSNAKSDYKDYGGTTSTVNYRSSVSRERNIQYYYNPDNITEVTITSANIETVPTVKLKSLVTLNLSYNNIKNFPDLNSFNSNTNTLKSVYLRNNKFYLSENASERTLTTSIVNKIPAGITNLQLGSNFYGSIDENVFSRFTALQNLNLSRNGGPYFHPDGINSATNIPNVSNTCTSYNITNNDFRNIGSSSGNNKNIKELTNATNIIVHGNYYLDDNGNFSISNQNNVLSNLDMSSTNLNIPVLQGKDSLVTVNATWTRGAGGLFSGNTYKFNNCNSLQNLYLYAAGLSGDPFPRFTNPSLLYLDLRWSNLVGGYKDGSTTDNNIFIHENTFKDCTSLQTFYIQHGGMLQKDIANAAFSYTPDLRNLLIISYGRVTGAVPNFSSCTSLSYLHLHYNNFSSGTPNFAANPSINYVNLSYNKLSGAIPSYKNLPSLHQLYLHNNKFTSLGTFENLPYLYYFYCHNQFVDGNTGISGEIPDFSGCPKMYYLVMYNNNFSSYKSGSFETLYNLRYLDVSNNSLSSQAIDQIIEDLYTNYVAVPRGRVSINIRGNQLPGEEALDKIVILQSKGWSITYQ